MDSLEGLEDLEPIVCFMFTLFLFVFDKLFDTVFPSKTKKTDINYDSINYDINYNYA